ncbi:FHS family L-fucose permease-like MFS transporter [Novosphingobium sp. PhB165]|uniref:glucose/galactose MFS transporter n=1 Tax=Novosphingobium sp. PhB165 TaxID=2485105 RepID=UPI00105182EC|nr:glucose/galactose MFS transporter [Novosphingobium sp. PhB165]TCM17892.1 FHS family L-fucose permease-like MFS transporter [Novosphingobium sp. PhB165]
MALKDFAPTSTDPEADPGAELTSSGHINAPGLQVFVFALFFIFGGVTALNGVLMPKLKAIFVLDYTEAMLVNTAFFAAYAVLSVPGAGLVKRIGYMRGAALGLLAMLAGCLLFVPAATGATFALFLLALFVLASGVTLIQVVANPLISLLGPSRTASSRLNFAQGFNALGATVFPHFGAVLMLGGLASVNETALSGAELEAYRSAATQAIAHGYLMVAAALAVITAAVWFNRNRIPGEKREGGPIFRSFNLLLRPRFAFGAICIFLYVGVENAIASLVVSWMGQSQVLSLDPQTAGTLLPWYWGGALIGRFVGSWALRFVSAGKALATVAIGAVVLLAIAVGSTGTVAGVAFLATGLTNAIMFPTIFSLACEGLGERTPEGSGVICTMVVGGAVIPPLTGLLADSSGSLSLALALPALCYAVIALFGWSARRSLEVE